MSGKPGRIPVGPFREAFESSEMTLADVARRLDWYDSRGDADGSRLSRVLGLRPQQNNSRTPRKREWLSYDNAERLCDALGLDYWQVGL
jgi:hypothetical protein